MVTQHKQNKKQTKAQKKARAAAKRERQRKYRMVMINGKQKRVKREPTIDGLSVDEFILANANPIFLHELGAWELMGDSNSSFAAELDDATDEDKLFQDPPC